MVKKNKKYQASILSDSLKRRWLLGAKASRPAYISHFFRISLHKLLEKKIKYDCMDAFFLGTFITFDNLEAGLRYFALKLVSLDASNLFAFAPQTPTIAANCFYNIIPNLPPPTPY